MTFRLTVSLDVAGRPAVVVGGGREAVTRVDALTAAGADVTVVTPSPAPSLVEAAADGRLRLLRRDYRPGDLVDAFVAYVTGEDATDRQAAWEEAEANGVLLSTLDDVARCHFATPATVRRGDLVVAVATAGRAPALAKRLRRRLEELIGPEHGGLVDVLDAARQACLPRTVPFPEWAARWEAALHDLDGLLALVGEGRSDEARERVVAALRTPAGDRVTS